jgi:hypothetical protein
LLHTTVPGLAHTKPGDELRAEHGVNTVDGDDGVDSMNKANVAAHLPEHANKRRKVASDATVPTGDADVGAEASALDNSSSSSAAAAAEGAPAAHADTQATIRRSEIPIVVPCRNPCSGVMPTVPTVVCCMSIVPFTLQASESTMSKPSRGSAGDGIAAA